MKISYVIPNLAGGKHFLQPPLDALYSLSYLKNEGHECTFIDNRTKKYNFDELVKNIPESDVIIINTAPYDFSQMYHFDYRLLYGIATVNRIKQNYPKIPLILTGIHANARPDLMIKDTNADILLLGEVEQSLVKLINVIEEKSDLKRVNNIIIKSNNKTIPTLWDNELAHPSLEGLLMPDYDAINFENYYGYELEGDKFKRINRWGIILGSRGCQYKCKFCHNFWGDNIRYRSVNSVVNEMELLEKKYDVKNIFFLDPNFTANKKWAKDISKEVLNKKLNIKWSIQTRFDLVDEEILREMASSNCDKIFYGLESYNNPMLKRMNKNINTNTIDQTVKLTRESGITSFMFIMLGLPGETKEGIENTVSFLEKNELPYIAIVYGPRFGTQFEVNYEKSLGKSLKWEDLVTLKGKIDNDLDTLYLSKVVRMLRTQNVLRKKNAMGNDLE